VVAIVNDVDEAVDALAFACSVDSGDCAVSRLWNIYGICTWRRCSIRQMPNRGKSGSDAEISTHAHLKAPRSVLMRHSNPANSLSTSIDTAVSNTSRQACFSMFDHGSQIPTA